MPTRRSILKAGLGGLAGLLASRASALPPPIPPLEVVTSSVPINHVLLNGESVIWTQHGRGGNLLRSMPKEGGDIADLAAQPLRDQRGFKVTYAHIQQIEDALYWTRQRVGFEDHWGILTTGKGGGPVSEVLPEDVGLEPLYLPGWRIAEDRIVAVVLRPGPLRLPSKTFLAAYDPEEQEWTPLIDTARFPAELYLLAGDENFAYVRGINANGRPEIGRVSPSQGAASYQTMFVGRGTDRDLAQPGAVDGTALYYWSRRNGGSHTLDFLALAGGTPGRLHTGGLGLGLTADGSSLYWCEASAIRRLPAKGGTPITIAGGAVRDSTVGGLAVDETSIYYVKKASEARFMIVKAPK